MCDVLLPEEWYSHEDQAKLIRANIKYPVYTRGLGAAFGGDALDALAEKRPQVFVPNFGDESLGILHRKTGGDPLFDLDRANVCLAFTPIVKGFNYERSLFGTLSGDAAYAGIIPDHFVENAVYAQQVAQLIMRENANPCDFVVMGAKLNQLQSGSSNIVLYLNFPAGCPFTTQTYLTSRVFDTKVRVMPSPIMTLYKEEARGVKLVLRFLAVDQELYDRVYKFLQRVIVDDLKMFLRYIKTRAPTLEVYAQHDTDTPDDAKLAKLLRGLARRRRFHSVFTPSVFTGFSWDWVTF